MADQLPAKDAVWKYKKYLCRAKCYDLTAGGRIVVLNEAEAHENDLYTGHRVILQRAGKQSIATLDVSSDLVGRGQVGLFAELSSDLGASAVGGGLGINRFHGGRGGGMVLGQGQTPAISFGLGTEAHKGRDGGRFASTIDGLRFQFSHG